MRDGYSEQYEAPVVIIEETDIQGATADELVQEILDWAVEYGAYYSEDAPNDCLVLQFPDRFPELYTEAAMRRSVNQLVKRCGQPMPTSA